MPRIFAWMNGLLIASLIAAGPPVYHVYLNRTYRNFRVVHPGLLYRSGQMSQAGLERIIHDYGIRTVITLRDADVPGQLPPDWEEEEYCRKEELWYFRLSPKHWWAPEGEPPAAENVKQFLEIVDNPKYYPILIHCFAGTHRSGAYCAIYRMEFDHWSNEQALTELHSNGYDHLWEEDDVRGYLQNYEPRWRRQTSTSSAFDRESRVELTGAAHPSPPSPLPQGERGARRR
ncbi:MAG TPA: dual specificity protein phosphatase family protein [Gemmataceae bacterium]|nr:dual specificity protein phosphatase family protein [Gemmataceae bacterium]